ncbi:hypothetical protein Fmac_011926 [Flemingia macrophylla]|uniref:Uncharacterized protein n=1 Tax=Flemingia macrophylla TaxID=520843 RepID=A0ABD1MNV1_9FABA
MRRYYPSLLQHHKGSCEGILLHHYNTTKAGESAWLQHHKGSCEGISLHRYNTTKVGESAQSQHHKGSCEGIPLHRYNTTKVDESTRLQHHKGSCEDNLLDRYNTTKADEAAQIASFQMEDIFLSIVQKIIQCSMDPILHHGRYLCCFNHSVENLAIAKEKLELTQDRVKKQVIDATGRTEIIELIVENWLKEVENVLQEVNMLEGKISEASKSCFRKQCQYFLV